MNLVLISVFRMPVADSPHTVNQASGWISVAENEALNRDLKPDEAKCPRNANPEPEDVVLQISNVHAFTLPD